MFFIVWGRKVRDVKRSVGRFFCPGCRSEQACTVRSIGVYFTLYWIPLFETKRLENYSQCDACHGKFLDAQVQEGGAAETWSCPSCATSNPSNLYQCVHCGLSLT